MFDYLIIFASLVVLDVMWLTFFMSSFYKRRLGHIMPEKVSLVSTIPFYVIFSVAILVFIVSPAEILIYTHFAIFMRGALLGLAAYAAYDFTNQATIKDWSWSLTIVDLCWGAFMTGAVSLIAVAI